MWSQPQMLVVYFFLTNVHLTVSSTSSPAVHGSVQSFSLIFPSSAQIMIL